MNWNNTDNDQVYSESDINRRLQAQLPEWSYRDGCIQRTYKTAGWKSTLMLVNTIGHLAEAAFHHPELVASYPAVTVKLNTHSAKGVTNKDFELALKIEAVVMWQPAKEGGALEGTPDDPRYRYIIFGE